MGGEVAEMDMKTLSHYLDTVQQIERDKGILENLRARAAPASPAWDGLPHGGGGHADRTAHLAVEIAALSEKLEKLEDEAAAELDALEAFASTIDDERVRLSVSLRFIHGWSWADTAETLGYWDASGCRKLVSRYLAHSN